MIRVRDISIRNKLILMQVFTSVLVLSIVFAVFVITDIRSYKQRKIDNVAGLAHVIGNNCASTLMFQDDEAAREILAELRTASPEVIHAGLIDKNGKLFAGYTRPGAGSLNIPKDLPQSRYVSMEHELFVSDPVFNKNELIGKVFLEVELNELEEIKKSKYELAIVLLWLAIGFSFIVAVIVQRYISRRLLKLVDTINQVSAGSSYVPMQETGRDEIGTLIKEFDKLMQQVKESQQKKDEFIGVASHELKTPLTSIKGYVELLRDLEDRERNKQFIQKALENINKLESLIKDLLDVSKIQSGQLQLNIRDFRMDEMLVETISAFQMISPDHQIIKEGSFGEEEVIADRQRIEQVVINLLSNAVKYSPGEKKVIVYCMRSESDFIVRVRDFGIGVSQEERFSIFERFYRQRDVSVHVAGFGLGLYICRDIIDRHEGRIWVEQEEKGSSFYFSLPAVKRPAMPALNGKQAIMDSPVNLNV